MLFSKVINKMTRMTLRSKTSSGKRIRSRVVSDSEDKPKRRKQTPPPSDSDSDYEPDESSSDEETSDEETSSEEDVQEPIIMLMEGMARKNTRRSKKNIPEFAQNYNQVEWEYFKNLTEEEKTSIATYEAQLKQLIKMSDVPMRFRIFNSPIPDIIKATLLRKLEQSQQMEGMSSEYFKLNQWLDVAMRLPFGKYAKLKVSHEDPPIKITEFLNETRVSLDKNVYGHQDAKTQILRILAQWISKPESKGNVIGICGSMGIGKTNFIKNGISKTLGLPFAFVGLGGASDGSFLEGHSYTYEGSTYGKIAELLIKSQCMNPIIFFDELDKVSETSRGNEIYNILMHITDSTQNDRFNDRYFSELDLDLSKALIVFSYNDESRINPILLDRMIKIRIPNGYSVKEKVHIAKNHLIPEITVEFGLSPSDIIIDDTIFENIISRVPSEDGVRNLKRGIECIISWINMLRYVPEKDEPIELPYKVTEEFVKRYLKVEEKEIQLSMYM